MRRALAAFLLSMVALAAQAGTACTEKALTPQALQQGLELGLRTRAALEASGAQVAIVGRVGSDLKEYGLRYSHAGLAWRDHPKGRWLVVHMLNRCGTASSDLFDEGLGNFFLDSPFAYEALLVVPSAATQARLAGLLRSDTPHKLFEPGYSMIANPWSTRYQNSNQWLLELVAAALAERPGASRAEVQEWLRASGYRPGVITLPPLKRLGARMFAANTRFDDHTNEEWASSRYNVVSVESIQAFLARRDGASTSVVR